MQTPRAQAHRRSLPPPSALHLTSSTPRTARSHIRQPPTGERPRVKQQSVMGMGTCELQFLFKFNSARVRLVYSLGLGRVGAANSSR